MSKIAVVRVRGNVKVMQVFIDTMRMLNIDRKNYCAVMENTPSVMGMIQKVKDFITWGEVSDDILRLLEKKSRGKFYALQPPRGGYGRKGTKMPFVMGGALGNRGDKINDLLKRMI